MSYSNKHLTEVLCSFEFIEEESKWDSTYFGSYFEKIRPLGFSERQERKGVPNMLPVHGPLPMLPIPVDQFIFRHPTRNWGIIMSKASISFHVLSGYIGWSCFRDELIIPFYENYMSLGLGKGRRNCTVMYLNRLEKRQEEKLSDNFTIVSSMDAAFGVEKNTLIQRFFQKEVGLFLVTKLATQDLPDGKYAVNLECGATSVKGIMPWLDQAELTHRPVQDFFESIITDKQRLQL